MKSLRCWSLFLVLFALPSFAQAPADSTTFALKDGDKVVFYGDSITEQRLYTSFIEEYALTRFPERKIDFINSGVGGDRVDGGWAGPIDLRLARDVVAYQPTVVTIMLGMNDGYYRPYDDGIFRTYADGYRHIVDTIQQKVPNVRLLLLKPSPHDDVTRAGEFEPDYNTTMVRFGDFLTTLAAEKHAQTADLNAPVVDALTKAKADNEAFSTQLMHDRVHPGSGVHWIMAEAVLKSWNAPAVVTAVTLDAPKASATTSTNATVTELKKAKGGTLSWVQLDRALPLPLPSPKADPFIAMAEKVSDLDPALNRETLQITGLAAGNYSLEIDDRKIGEFTADQLASGVDLARLDTPMLRQSLLVAFDTDKKNAIEDLHFGTAQDARTPADQNAAKVLDAAFHSAVEQQRQDAQPIPHRYVLTPLAAHAAR
ncbi:MAG TPA: SGNH/GDSL hydrolase family protein [Candidatus Sulfotelmatobacter sp.]|nr:SGNH/GDSL hydrolase family protein [Candidatus Sulfotelmatobacter sp.]